MADMRDLSALPNSDFDAVLVGDNSLPHLLSNEDLRTGTHFIHLHLADTVYIERVIRATPNVLMFACSFLGGQSKAATLGHFKTGHFEGLRHSFDGGEFSLCQHGQCLEQREAGTGDSVGAVGLAPSADRGGDGSPSRDGGRLPAVSRHRGSLAGDVGTEVSFKSGHFSDHRLLRAKSGHRSDYRP